MQRVNLILFLTLVLVSAPLDAYVGPGAGLSLLGALWGLLAAVAAALAFLLVWPLRRMQRRRREAAAAERRAALREDEQRDPDANERPSTRPGREEHGSA